MDLLFLFVLVADRDPASSFGFDRLGPTLGTIHFTTPSGRCGSED